jgi:hypothetical protein
MKADNYVNVIFSKDSEPFQGVYVKYIRIKIKHRLLFRYRWLTQAYFFT